MLSPALSSPSTRPAELLRLAASATRYLLRHGWTAEDAEDLAAEGVARILAAGMTVIGDPSAYYWRALRNLECDAYRELAKRPRPLPLSTEPTGNTPAPPAVLQSRESVRAIHAALDGLTARDLAIVTRAAEGMPGVQQAKLLGVRLSAARTAVTRARDRLRKRL